MKLEMIYIGDQQSRFEYGKTYQAIIFTESFTTFLDNDNVPMDFFNDNLHHYFRQKQHWRNEQLEKLGI
jgi:hypothetical protein